MVIFPILCFSQKKKEPLGIALDYQFLRHQSFSVGLGYITYVRKNGKKEGWRIDIEYMPKDNPKMNSIYGVKLEGFLAYKKYLNFGYGFGFLTDKQGYKVIFTPEFGVGYQSIFIVYRRNLKIFGNNLDYLNKDNLSLRLYIPIDKTWVKLRN